MSTSPVLPRSTMGAPRRRQRPEWLQDGVFYAALLVLLLQAYSLVTGRGSSGGSSDASSGGGSGGGGGREALADTVAGFKPVHVFVGNSTYTPPENPWVRPGTNWTSQIGQDEVVLDILGGKRGGYFLDLAAHDALYLSNSYGLEAMYGWGGLCIEANMGSYLWGLAHRRCTVVAAAVWKETNVQLPFVFSRGVVGGIINAVSDNKDLSDGDQYGAQLRPTVRLADLLARFSAPRVIDYFSFDVEGVEHQIMEGFPWDQYIFLLVTVERPKPVLVQALRDNGYVFVRYHGGPGVDQLWAHSSLPDLPRVLARHRKPEDKEPEGV